MQNDIHLLYTLFGQQFVVLDSLYWRSGVHFHRGIMTCCCDAAVVRDVKENTTTTFKNGTKPDLSSAECQYLLPNSADREASAIFSLGE